MNATYAALACLAMIGLVGLAGCGGPEPLTCGEGTVLEGDQCVREIEACGEGTTLVDGLCVPEGAYCAPGTTLMEGDCVPEALACGEGTHLENGTCVPDARDPGPTPDVPESTDPATPATVTLAPVGETISIGGTISVPIDEDDDTYVDGDWDAFTFWAEAGTYLRFHATSHGIALPAFLISSTQTNADGSPLYVRYGWNPNAVDTVREVYLPRADTYQILVTDFAMMWPAVFGYAVLPIGGDDFTYLITIEDLGAPTVTAVSALPVVEDGDLTDGGLRFYDVEAGLTPTAITVTSRGVPPTPELNPDLFLALMVLDGTHALLEEEVAPYTNEPITLLLDAHVGQSYRIVQDFQMVLGPNRDFSLEIRAAEPQDCSTTSCDIVGVTAGSLFLAWDLAAGDFLAVGIYPEVEAGGRFDVLLLDEDLMALAPPTQASAFFPSGSTHYAVADQRVMLWVERAAGYPLVPFDVSPLVVATTAMAAGNDYTGLTVHVPPPDVFPPSGMGHFVGNAGQILIISGLTTYDAGAGWIAPFEQILTPAFDLLGPALDGTDRAGFPNTLFTPAVAWLPADGHYLHLVQDADDAAEINGGTYDVSVDAVVPVAVDTPTVGTDILRSGEQLDADAGLVIYSFVGNATQRTDITITPAASTTITPQISVLTLGFAGYLATERYWQADGNAERLGRLAAATATGPGASVTLSYASPYDGVVNLVVITDADGGGGAADSFDLELRTLAPPANDTCDSAEVLDLSTGSVVIVATTVGASNAGDLGSYNSCTNGPTEGPDLFYAVDLVEGDDLTVTVSPENDFNAVLYLFRDCADAEACAAFASEIANPEILSWTVPAGGTGTYLLAVDGSSPAAWGGLSLTVGVN